MILFDIFKSGAMALATETMEYVSVHRNYGINQDDWDLIISKEIWTVNQRQRIRSMLTEIINISMTISGIPAQPLPAQYVAAVISIIVSPCNRLVACSCAPETFDGEMSSGLIGKAQVKPVPITTLISLVVAYSSHQHIEPNGMQVSKDIQDQSVTQVTKENVKK